MRPLSPLVAPYIAPSRPSLASWRLATAPSSTIPWYRSAPRADLASARSPLIPASTRGSSWATSATTNATVVGHGRGSDLHRGDRRAPPLDDHRPVAEPDGWYDGRNLPPLTHSSIRPSRWSGTGARAALVTQQRDDARVLEHAQEDARVSVTSSPARRSAASSSGRESGLRPGTPNASRTSSASASSPCGRAPRRRPRRAIGEQALVDVHPPARRRTSSRPRRGHPPTPPRAAARAGRPRSMPPPRPAAEHLRGRRAGARPCRRSRTGPDRTA